MNLVSERLYPQVSEISQGAFKRERWGVGKPQENKKGAEPKAGILLSRDIKDAETATKSAAIR